MRETQEEVNAFLEKSLFLTLEATKPLLGKKKRDEDFELNSMINFPSI